jgi:hypothetical protein
VVDTARDDGRGQSAAEGVQRPQAKTTERREAVLKAAMNVFGARGNNKGSLVEVAEHAGMTHAGVLHHFGSKEGLLVAMLKYCDGDEVGGAPAPMQTGGRRSCSTSSTPSRRTPIAATSCRRTRCSRRVRHRRASRPRLLPGRFQVLRAKIAGVLGEVSGTPTSGSSATRHPPSSRSWTACRCSGSSSPTRSTCRASSPARSTSSSRGCARRLAHLEIRLSPLCALFA